MASSSRIPPPRVGEPTVRHRFLVVVILLASLALSTRLLWVQGLNSRALAAEARESRTVERTIPALRGDILDRDGKVLAASVERYDLWVDQRQVDEYRAKDEDARPEEKGVKGAARTLAPVLGMTPAEAEKKLSGTRGFVYLSKGVDPAVRDATMALRIPGVGSDRVAQRTYPSGEVAGNVLGFVSGDGEPLAGTEIAYDDVLRGENGRISYERGAGGQIIPTAPQATQRAVDGRTVELTIDQDLQWRTQQILAQTVDRWGGSGGSAVVMNARTGEVLALADYPTYDPNAPGRTDAKYRGNQSLSNVFEPGSTGKLFTMAAAIEEGTVSPTSQYTIPSTMTFDGQRIKDSHAHEVQKLTLAGVLAQSSNVGTVQVSQTLDDRTRYEYLRRFGLGQRTGVGLPGESAGILHAPEDWDPRMRFTTSFGQGYSVNALQMVSAVSTFANDGVRVQPSLVRGVMDESGTLRPLGEPTRTRVVSSQTAATMVQLMDNNIVDDGKHNGNIPHYAVGGKSGTAQVPDGTYTASFIGIAPADDPELVTGVFIYGLTSFISGTTAAAPAFSEVMGYALQNQGVAPTGRPGRDLEDEW
ncbi:penicillin-binding protein 2 [Brachybacterium sp. EF45031]|uniref:peptidoglycan D,D-transpeptidase FtsI family protein n=1 Tax=Brachybacterium sillae TaxID=2810536 RepID=UPI00217E4D22|nr:penicillin-binding protein 2 [Brachybacterium sillae]MCS6712397.1 penicillin-binding protein 2 [Brachybacterium sillae]